MILLVRYNWWEVGSGLDADTFDERSLQGDVELLQSLQYSDQRVHQRAVLNQRSILVHLSSDWTVHEQSDPVMQQMVPERRRHNVESTQQLDTKNHNNFKDKPHYTVRNSSLYRGFRKMCLSYYFHSIYLSFSSIHGFIVLSIK